MVTSRPLRELHPKPEPREGAGRHRQAAEPGRPPVRRRRQTEHHAIRDGSAVRFQRGERSADGRAFPIRRANLEPNPDWVTASPVPQPTTHGLLPTSGAARATSHSASAIPPLSLASSRSADLADHHGPCSPSGVSPSRRRFPRLGCRCSLTARAGVINARSQHGRHRLAIPERRRQVPTHHPGTEEGGLASAWGNFRLHGRPAPHQLAR